MYLKRSYIVALHDIFMASLSFLLSLYLRLGESFIVSSINITMSLMFAVVCFTTFTAFKLYKGMWRYAALQDLIAITKAVTISILVFLLLMFLINRLETLPRSIFFINWLVLLALLGGPRFMYRIFKDRRVKFDLRTNIRKIPILLLDINTNTELFLRAVIRSSSTPYEVVGIIDNNKSRIGSNIYNVKVLGDYTSILKVYNKLKKQGIIPQKLVLTSDFVDGQLVRNLLTTTDSLGMSLARLPKLTDLKVAQEEKLEINPIVIQDLLGRAQHVLDKQSIIELIANKKVLVTGGGGTIGSELVRQIIYYSPSDLTVIDSSEYNLYNVEQELNSSRTTTKYQVVLADIRNSTLLEKIFDQIRPDLVFHAAALKHVPIAEHNICESVLTNIRGTKNIADLCLKYNVLKMIMISTDKAVNPVNVMGATKKVAESYIQAIGQSSTLDESTSFVTVRFGNVLGSSGSVIPLFEKQLKNGGPLTITHPDMVRYFMTVREAVELVLQASTLEQDNSHNAIFVLDMGEAVKIKDLAIQMIKMAGLEPEIDIKIEYIGIRPGEKLYEELFHFSEYPSKTSYESIMRAIPRIVDLKILQQLVNKVISAAQNYDDQEVIKLLKELVPEYSTNIETD